MPGIELSHIRKRFGSLVALDDVTVRILPGRVHGLLGENGAGKSTLMNVLYGLLRAEGGVILRDDRPLRINSPHDAIAAGVGMVHQHFMLAGAMTVLDNVLLGDRRARRLLDRAAAAQKLAGLAERLGLPIDPAARIDALSVGQQQRVEILKALYRDVSVLVLDEPTAVLTPVETEQLMAAVSQLRAEGKSVVFISHKLGEVKRICDDLTVLRRGKVVWEGLAEVVTEAELAKQMVGREVKIVSRSGPLSLGTPGERVRVRGSSNVGAGSSVVPPSACPPVSSSPEEIRAGKLPVAQETPSPRPSPREGRARASQTLALEAISAPGLHNISLSISRGEILGIAGVDGNGQQELAEVVVGLRRPSAGRIFISEADVTPLPLHRRQELGVAHIPNDRKREGLIGSMSIAQNIALKRHDRRPFSVGGWMRWWTIRKTARRLAATFDVRAASIDVPVGTLSGGNAQKVILARELALAEPKLIVAMNPVRGLDIAATNFVYEQLLARRAAGCAILLISSELDELLSLCDRIGVLYSGRLTMSGYPSGGGKEIGRLMAGLKAEGLTDR